MSQFNDRLKAFSNSLDRKEEQAMNGQLEIDEERNFAIYKRTPEGRNKVLFTGLTKKEADHKFDYLNTVEQAKRRRKEIEMNDKGLEYVVEAKDITLFDVVEIGTVQENPYWNPLKIVIE